MQLYGFELDPQQLPRHVGFIMDGNGRWANKRGLPRIAGHEKGYLALKRIIDFNKEIGVKFISVYAFSTENWTRPASEVDFLMGLARKLVLEYTPTLLENDIRLAITGSRDNLSADLLQLLDESVAKTAHCKSYTFNIAFNYGGRREIVDAVKRIASKIETGDSKAADITEADITGALYHPEIPDLDLLIRTSGEQRVSNFMLWQGSYSELYFTKKLWPDYSPKDYCRAIALYQKRKRRFGGV